ncbi:hypothetical protein KRR26_00310 [Corallococcus sp. M34]|uniref:hypothetical protein n=1 Tax=Citreicoccus inhibens TaxID=2849499 RepID=UPI001C23F424|nr:hypothetical protein [Citreicoccus inhibens]MBU8894019.1 hypothetical protein [Citreicoccus inhibens]
MSESPPASPPDHDEEALRDLSMWITKLRNLENITVEPRGRLSRGSNSKRPAHSKNFFNHLSEQNITWRATDGSDHSGAVAVIQGSWFQDSDSYTFAPEARAMIVDVHNDHAMAFLLHEASQGIDEARVVAASAGEEDSAVTVAQSMAEYTRKAVEARFASHWFTHPEEAQAVRQWVDAQPLRKTPKFSVEIEAVEMAPSEEALRTQLIEWLPPKRRRLLATAAGAPTTDCAALARAIATVLATGKPAAQAKLEARLREMAGWDDWREAFFLDALPSGLCAVRLRATRLGVAFHSTTRNGVPLLGLQLLLDAPGAQALHHHVNADHLRFCRSRGFDLADDIAPLSFAQEPEHTLRKDTAPGEVRYQLLMPKALVPAGCTPGAKFDSIAPADDISWYCRPPRSV